MIKIIEGLSKDCDQASSLHDILQLKMDLSVLHSSCWLLAGLYQDISVIS